MQDRFKFRGKRLDNGQWYSGSYLYLHNAPQYKWNGDKTQTKEDVHYIIDDKDINYAVDPETVGQYTGLKDKNGKLIYEGDIIKEKWYSRDDEKYRECLYSVEYDKEKMAYCFVEVENGFKNFFVDMEYIQDDYEIIGNVYENPELLEEQE